MSTRIDNATIVWVGDSGLRPANESLSIIPFVHNNNVSEALTFTTAMEAHTLCNARFTYYTLIYNHQVSPPAAGANVDERAIIVFRDPNTMKVLNFQYPSPIAAEIEDIGYGKRIKKSAVEAVVALLNPLAEKTYEPMYGKFYQKI